MTIINYNGQQHKAKSPLEIMQGVLEASSFNFYLTGSRVFGKENTDYDYFVEDSMKCSKFLLDNRFDTVSNYVPASTIPFVCRVMRWTNLGFQIDVQLVNDAVKKSAIQQKIIAVFGADALDYPKRYMTKIWTFGYLLYKKPIHVNTSPNPLDDFKVKEPINKIEIDNTYTPIPRRYDTLSVSEKLTINDKLYNAVITHPHYMQYPGDSLIVCIRNKRIIPIIKFIIWYAKDKLNVNIGLTDSKNFVEANFSRWKMALLFC